MPTTVFERKWTGLMHPKEIRAVRKARKWDDNGVWKELGMFLVRSAKAFEGFYGDIYADEARRYCVTVTVEEV